MDELDRKIARILSEDRRRARARRVMSEAVAAHERAVSQGMSMRRANQVLLEFVGPESNESSLFSRAFQTLVAAAINPAVDEILDSLGIETHTKIHILLRNIIQSALTSTLMDAASGKIKFNQMFNCKFISHQLALSTAAAIPKSIFDAYLPDSSTGIMLTVREGIANYFKDTSTVEMIAGEFERLICNADLSKLLSGAASSIKTKISEIPG